MLAQQLADRLRAAGAAREAVVLVPVPMSTPRRLVRGIDHTLAIARGMRRSGGWPIRRLLGRGHRPAQAGVPRSRRAANVRGSFRTRAAGWSDLAQGSVIVLVDDVRTTGATMAEACRQLRRGLTGRGHGKGAEPAPRLWAAWVSVTPDDDERKLLSM